MKKITIFLAFASLIASCNSSLQDQNGEETETPLTSESTENISEETEFTAHFNINDVAFTTVDIGDFPFITLPKGLEEMNRPLLRAFDLCFFPIDGVMTPIDGNLYKTNVAAERGTDFSQHYFNKSMEDYLHSIGAVKVFDGEITKEEYDRYHKQDPNKGGEGDIGYWNENIKVWVIRPKDQGTIWVQYSSNNASGKLNILQEANFTQTITKVKAEKIVQDLIQSGKSILYINFKVDESTLTDDGKKVVTEIVEALKKDINLKISIEGHTDNSGSATHNKNLSERRAHTVMNALISGGIDQSRLSAKGLGAEKPLVANDSDENKSKNRRVELVRIN